MRRILLAISLCAAVGCQPNEAPKDTPKGPPMKPATPTVDTPPAPSTVPKVWQLTLTTQFLGTVPGPRQVVRVDSNGPIIKVEVDGKVVGEGKLAAADVEPLARLLGAPGLAAAKSGGLVPGQQVHLIVTGDVRLDLEGEVAALMPVLGEVDRLRDMVAPPENFKIFLTDGGAEILVSSNGYVEIQRGDAKVTHTIPTEALAKLRSLLSITALRDPKAWASDAGAADLRIEGDLTVRGKVDPLIKSVGTALLAELKRLAAAVEAKTRPMGEFEAVFTAQLHGAGLGPLRTITVRSRDRHIVLADEAPGVQPSDRPLKDDEWKGLLEMLVDPGFRLAEGRPPSGESMVYRVKISGDQPMDATFRGDPPPPLTNLLNRLDWLARHY